MLTKDFAKELRLARALGDDFSANRMTRLYCFSDDETILESEYIAKLLARPMLSSGVFETRDGWRVK